MNTPVTPDSPKRTVLDMLRRSAAEYPDTLYVNDRDDEGWCGLTYRRVLEESRRVAAGLLDLGIQPGDRVVMKKEHLLAEAKRSALAMVSEGYRPPPAGNPAADSCCRRK